MATPLELDRIKLRARHQAERSGNSFYASQKGKLMKSRLALMLMIALGLMMSTTGATLAITGSSGSGSAAQNQYKTVQPQQDDNPEPQAETLGDTGSGTAPAAEQVSVADDGGSLPFTGFVAIPLLIGGVALVSAGAFLRRKAD